MSRLKPGDAAKRRRPQDRSSCLLSDGEGTIPAATAAAGRVFQVARVTGRSRSPVRESSGHRFAEEDGATAAQLANNGGVFITDTALVKRRAVFGCHALGLDNVFYSERNLRQRSFAGSLPGLHHHPCMNRRLEVANP